MKLGIVCIAINLFVIAASEPNFYSVLGLVCGVLSVIFADTSVDKQPKKD